MNSGIVAFNWAVLHKLRHLDGAAAARLNSEGWWTNIHYWFMQGWDVDKVVDHIMQLNRESRMLGDFFGAYVEAALSSSTDNSTPSGGYPLDKNYSKSDIHPDTLAKMRADCESFYNANEIPEYDHREYSDDEMAGHDFWLTRNRSGSGFWDGDIDEENGKVLTDAAHTFGEYNLYVGDDNLIHGC